MDKSQNYQIVKLSFIAVLLLITPLLSTSMRPPYIYFLTNLLIIALGAEAGLLSTFFNHAEEKKPTGLLSTFSNHANHAEEKKPTGLLSTFSNHAEEKKPTLSIATKPIVVSDYETSPDKESTLNTNTNTIGRHESPDYIEQKPNIEQKPKAVEKSVSEKIVKVVKVHKVKKCPSTPSIFFIGGSEPEAEHRKEEEEEEEEACGLSGQELFTRAETFIGNFYKQLKIQREDSWKQIHGFYQKAF